MLNSKGYRVISAGYAQDELYILHQSMQLEVIGTVFGNSPETKEPFTFSPTNPEMWRLFTDVKLRKRILTNPNRIWKPRNHPLSKSDGMIDIHHNRLVHKKVLFDPRMYEILSKAYGCRELVHSAGPEKFSIKPPGATDMRKHIDANLWHPENNYPSRIQAFLTVNVPETGEWRDRGGLCVLTNFHHYWDFASAFFHYDFGLYPMDKTTSRFHLLPNDFDSFYLPRLTHAIQEYSKWQKGAEVDSLLEEFFIQIDGLEVPEEYQPIEWKTIECKSGDVVIWDQHLPHFSVRNRTDQLRSVVYYSVFPVTPAFYQSPRRDWVREQFVKNTFYYDVQAQLLTRKVRNNAELAYRENVTGLTKVYNQNELAQKLSAVTSWF